MALLFCDNFQQYGTGTNPAPMTEGEVYAEVTNCEITDDPDDTITEEVLHVKWGFGSSGVIRKVLPSSMAVGSPVGCGYRIWMDNLPTSSAQLGYLCVLRDGSNNDVVGIRVRTDGYLEALSGTNIVDYPDAVGATILGVSSGPALYAGAWQQVEVKMKVHATTGTVEVRVDGVVKLNLTGLNTGNVAITQMVHVNRNTGASSSFSFYMKDYFIWDTSGSFNNNFLGNCFVHSMVPDGDTSGTWTKVGAASAYDCINDSPTPDDTSTYISSAWPAATAQVCTVSDLPPQATQVLGMMTLIRSIKTDGGTANQQASLVSGTNTADGADTPVTTAWAYWTDIFETDPDTSAAWTVSAANAVKLKLNRTA